jgi:hypothetical protein
MLTLLAIGTLWFWVALVVLLVVITVVVESESGTWATVVTVGSLLGINYLYKLSLFTLAVSNPSHTLGLLLVYLVAGVVWSLIKWYFYLHERLKEFNESQAKFLKDNKATEMTPALAAQFTGSYSYTGIPTAKGHKADLTRWATYWPFSVVGSLLNDVVRKTWVYIFDLLQSTYQRMADSMFASAAKVNNLAKQHHESKR